MEFDCIKEALSSYNITASEIELAFQEYCIRMQRVSRYLR